VGAEAAAETQQQSRIGGLFPVRVFEARSSPFILDGQNGIKRFRSARRSCTRQTLFFP
jgi:hypothetical protein